MAIVGEAEIECLTCEKKVKAKITEFGEKFVADCPECCGVAYNSKKLPAGIMKMKE